MTLVTIVAVQVFVKASIEQRTIIIRAVNIYMAIEAIAVGVNPGMSSIMAGYLMTLQTELFGLLFQQIRVWRTVRAMTIDTSAIFRTEIARGFMFINKWTIHLTMAFIAGLIV